MDSQFYIIISSAILFIFSESLPFIKSIKANGILDVVVNVIKNRYKDTKETNTEEMNTEEMNTEETEPLVKSDIKRLNQLIETLLYKLEKPDDLLYNFETGEYNNRSLYLSSMDGQHIDITF